MIKFALGVAVGVVGGYIFSDVIDEGLTRLKEKSDEAVSRLEEEPEEFSS